MDAQLTAYVTLVSTSAVLNLFLCLYVLLRRHRYPNIATFFILNTAATAIYCFGYAFSLTSTTIEQVKFWNLVQYCGMPFAPAFGLLFVMQYLGMKVGRTKATLLLIIPSLSVLFDLTNKYHHLLYRTYEIDSVLGTPYVYKEYGIWFVVHGIFLFCCMLTGSILLLSRWKETAAAYRPQLIALASAQVLPMVTAFLYLINVTPAGVDPVPMVVWVSSILFLWAIHTSSMLSILPIAKETIFNSINDGVIVLDEARRLIDYNDACQHMMPGLQRSMYGQSIDKLWQTLFPEANRLPLTAENKTFDLPLIINDRLYIFQLRISPFTQGNRRKGLLLIFTDMTALKQLQQRLEKLAYYDELTGIYNRRAFFQQSDDAFETARKHKQPYTIILFDIDYFKKINDTYGHQIGDRMLLHVASICKAQLQRDMIFARYGGEEFVIALPNYTAVQGEDFANTLRKQITASPLEEEKQVIHSTSSFGVATVDSNLVQSWTTILQYADEALYAAKHGGRNQVKYTERA